MTLEQLGWSRRKLGAAFSCAESVKPELRRTERAIRDAVNRGEMRADVLDALSRFLDVEPDLLSGKLHRSIWRLDLPKEAKWSLVSSLKPENFRYGTLHTGESTFRYIEDLLALHGVAPRQYEEFSRERQLDFAEAIENALVPVIIDFFPKNAAGRNIEPGVWSLFVQIQDARDEFYLEPNEPVFD
ncbi:hypothetical protein [Eggerthella sinensis]|nr:hypothetical protein [Eggerthella sinensis]